jgi:hypothetical protein
MRNLSFVKRLTESTSISRISRRSCCNEHAATRLAIARSQSELRAICLPDYSERRAQRGG